MKWSLSSSPSAAGFWLSTRSRQMRGRAAHKRCNDPPETAEVMGGLVVCGSCWCWDAGQDRNRTGAPARQPETLSEKVYVESSGR